MKLNNERKEEVYTYDLDCSDEETTLLTNMAIERFAQDKQAQLEYAIVSLLKDVVDKKDAREFLKKMVEKLQGEENGDKNNDRKQNLDSPVSSD
jgi:hypothetical protein